MQERNVLQEVFTATLTLFTDLLEPVKWFILAAVCLIVADLKFGIRGSSEARGEDTDESGDSAEREQIGGLYLLDIGGHEFRESVRRTFRIADTPGIGAVGGLRLRDQFVFQQLLRSSGK